MLGYLQGTLFRKNPDTHQCILICGGAGYEVTVSSRTLDALTEASETSLWVHTHVREDLFVLYGFQTEMEKHFFRILLGVSGLGPKTALSLLSEHGAEKLTQLIISKEADEIATAQGVGKKLAQRITLELASKLEKLAWVAQLEQRHERSRSVPLSPIKQLRDDLSSALANLGYQPMAIKAALDRILENEELETPNFEVCLKTALQELSGRALSKGRAEITHG